MTLRVIGKYGRVIIATIILVMLLSSAAALLYGRQTIYYSGMVIAVNIGVYEDSACTSLLNGINSTSVYAGGNVSTVMYLKNTGNVPITLSFTNTTWIPTEAGNVLSFSWDAPASLQPDESQAVSLTLTAVEDTGTLKNFSVVITVIGTEQ